MLDAPGAGLAAPQIGVGLRVFTYYVDGELGHLVNPEPRPVRRRCRTARRAACPSPASTSTPRARCASWPRAATCTASRSTLEGTELLARCIQHETDHLDGILFIDRMDRAQRKLAMKAIREAEWAGQPAPTVKAQPALDLRPGPVAGAAGLRRHPRGRRAQPRGAASPPATRSSRVVTRPDARVRPRPRGSSPSPVRRAGRGARRRGADARPRPATPTSASRLRRAGPRRLPDRRVRRASSRRRRWTSRPHGWVNLHFSLLPAWRGAAPVQHAVMAGDEVTGATTFRIERGPGHRARRTA